jgi:uncharacterized protein (TIGR00369 family)
MTKSRTFEWADPGAVAADARRQPGVEFLRSIAGRERLQAAPVAECLGFQLVEAEVGRVVFELRPAEFHFNPIGSVHGGVLATLCDSAAGAAVHSVLPEGVGYTTLEIKVSFLRPVGIDTGLLRCEGTVLSRGSRVAVSEARLTDAAGKLYAHATSTCLVLTPEGARAR